MKMAIPAAHKMKRFRLDRVTRGRAHRKKIRTYIKRKTRTIRTRRMIRRKTAS